MTLFYYLLYFRIRSDSIRMAMHMDITIFTNINVMAENMTTLKLELGRNRKKILLGPLVSK